MDVEVFDEAREFFLALLLCEVLRIDLALFEKPCMELLALGEYTVGRA